MKDISQELYGLLGFAEALEGKAAEVWGDVAGTCGDGRFKRVENALMRTTASAKQAKECAQEAVSVYSTAGDTAADELGKALEGCRNLLHGERTTQGVYEVATHVRHAIRKLDSGEEE